MNHFVSILKRDTKDILIICLVTVTASLVLYGYYMHFTPHGMSFIFRNWDGPGYAVVAKSFYNVPIINKVNPFWFLDATHYAFQFPLYPVFIRIFSFLGYDQSMIFVSRIFSLFFSISLYYLVKMTIPKANALVVALLSVFYTPRWFIVSHVGSTEPQFVFFITMFMIAVLKRKFGWAAVCISLAQLTKPQGIVYFAGIGVFYVLSFLFRKKTFAVSLREFIPFFLVPLSLIAIFIFYAVQYGNFFIFFQNEAFPTMQMPPLKIFTATEVYNTVIGLFTVWKESLIYTYIVFLIPIIILFEKRLSMFATVALVYYLPVLLFVQTDMARFILPNLPFVFLGFAEGLSKKPVYIGLFLCIPMIYMYAVGYINFNLSP